LSARPHAFSLLALALLAGCGSEVAQTAYAPPSEQETLECGSPGALVPPAAPEFGGGSSVVDSDLVLTSYGAGVGPGIYVTARDGFRLFVNGELLAESEAAREPAFVPLTLLPGKNVIGVVAYAEQGIPAALVEVAELDRSHASGSGWKVSADPQAGFSEPGFDDSLFEPVTDYGPIGSRPGCDPESVFPSDSPAHWIGPDSAQKAVALRYEIDIAPVGFARVTGGTGVPVLVTTIPEFEAWLSDETARILLLPEGLTDFRPTGEEVRQQDTCPTACPNEAKQVYTVLVGAATCDTELVSRPRNDRRLAVGSNKTVVGLGRGAQLRGASFDLSMSQNVIFRNVAVYDVNRDMIEAGDGFDLAQVDNVWLDHVTLKWISDGFTDGRPGSRGVTISWARYDGSNELACGGRHPRASQFSETEATIHHSWWDSTNSRSPLFDSVGARAHLFNNVIGNNADFGVGSACGAEVLLEGSTFENVTTPTLKWTCPDTGDLVGSIRAPLGSNSYGANVGPHRIGSTEAPEPSDAAVFTPTYEYSVEAADIALSRVRSRAGAGGPWAQALDLD
jgi:pectate lyase